MARPAGSPGGPAGPVPGPPADHCQCQMSRAAYSEAQGCRGGRRSFCTAIISRDWRGGSAVGAAGPLVLGRPRWPARWIRARVRRAGGRGRRWRGT